MLRLTHALRRAPVVRRCLSTANGMDGVPLDNTKHFINGSWVTSTGSEAGLPVTDSNTGAVFAHAPDGSVADMEAAIDAAHAAFPGWAATPLEQRIAHLEAFGAAFKKRQGAVGAALERELGAPHAFAKKVQAATMGLHVTVSVECAREFAWESEIEPYLSPTRTLLLKEPIGVVGAITPW